MKLILFLKKLKGVLIMNKNIAILIPNLNKGGAERIAANISCHLPNKYNVYFFLFDDQNIT